MKQIGLGMNQYSQDYDETVVPYRVGGSAGFSAFIGQPGVGTPQSGRYRFYNYLLQPYIKSDQVWRCPSRVRPWVNADTDPNSDTATDFLGYGGQNSYGVSNYAFKSGTGVKLASFAESTNTVGMVDARYYNVLPKAPAASTSDSSTPAGKPCKLKGDPGYTPTADNQEYWKNIGASYLFQMQGGPTGTEVRPTDAEAETLGQSMHMGTINTLFMDGHAKSLRWEKVAIDPELKQGGTTSLWDPYKQGCF